jgi:UTP:GlnB (protein PII) uridylyltransferase
MIKLSDVTIEKIKNEYFINDLPELYELKNVIENNLWHVNDSVFNHTINVLQNMESLLNKTNEKIKNYLNEKIEKYSRRDLLFLATIFHDIGKKETFVKEGDITSTYKHPEIGYSKTKKILEMFDLSQNEKNIVLDIIENHGVVSDIVNFENDNLEEDIKSFNNDYKSIFIELILFIMADTSGSKLKNKNPLEYKFRMDFYKNIIDKY